MERKIEKANLGGPRGRLRHMINQGELLISQKHGDDSKEVEKVEVRHTTCFSSV
jgi:hypothetical protein